MILGHRPAAVSRLRWVMLAVIAFDHTATLAGQPPAFWQHPERMNEHNTFIFGLASHGLLPLLLYMLVYPWGAWLFVTYARRSVALVGLSVFTLVHFYGGSTWLDRHWHLGTTAMVTYAIVLGTVIMITARREPESEAQPLRD